MTPEREEEIRKWIASPLHEEFYSDFFHKVKDLLAEIDRLREIRINSQHTYDEVLEQYARLVDAAREAHEAFSMYHSSDGRERATKVFSALKTHLEEK